MPNFCLKKAELMSGTSMASPHACGCVSLLLSALKRRGMKYSPFSVKRALENSAKFVGNRDPYAQGHGLLQVSIEAHGSI